MATIVTRAGKGSPLTNTEVDSNFTNLNTDKIESGDTVASLTITSADINGGTIDGVTIGGSSAGAITGTTITGTSFVTSGNMTFGDNDKAIFGAGSDLQIYSDGTNSYIDEVSTGSFYIRANNFYVTDPGGTAKGLSFIGNDTLRLYHDNAEKLATTSTGIDVTGTVTADRLDIDFGTANSAAALIDHTDTANGNGVLITAGGSNSGKYVLNARDGSGNNKLYVDTNGDISFYEDTGTTAKFRWDASAESLGIGTSSPSGKLDVNTDTATNIKAFAATNGQTTTFAVTNFASGNFRWGDMKITHRDGSSVDTTPIVLAPRNEDIKLQSQTAHNIIFGTNATERMRIDSSGRLYVGATALGTVGSTVGSGLYPEGYVAGSADGAASGYFARKTSDGDIVQFRKDGTTVGSIGTNGGDLFISNSDTGLRYRGIEDNIIPCDGSGNSRDNAVSLGGSSYRFKDLYLSGGIYLGGTGAANYLDDYEEGTWTPTINFGGNDVGQSYTIRVGYYTKIGRSVHIMCYMILSNKGSSTGDATIRGLPFVPSGSDAYSAGSLHLNSVSFADWPNAWVVAGSARVDLAETTNAGAVSDLLHSNFTTGSGVIFSASYITDS